MNLQNRLLKNWCDGLLHYQLKTTGNSRLDGGFLCPACMHIHGRSGDAVFPLTVQWYVSGEERYLKAAQDLAVWSENMVRPDGSYNNDTISDWNGITVFAEIALGETLFYFEDKLPEETARKWRARFERTAEYLFHNIEKIGGNINYPVTGSYALALASKLIPQRSEEFEKKAKAQAKMALEYFSEEGLLYGEGKPWKGLTPKNCRPVDIGYNVEESLPALIQYAELMEDKEVLETAKRAALVQLNFMLPDGGWNNSFGSRSYKWSYWGSRTSDGCLAGFSLLSKYDPVFAEAVNRNLRLLEQCTKDNLLYGGPMYVSAGEPPCIHHTFCHAKAVALLVLHPERLLPQKSAEEDAVDKVPSGCNLTKKVLLPAEKMDGILEFPTVATRLLSKNGWQATVTDYDYQYLPGGHPTGGAISLLWNHIWGPVLFGGMEPYTQNEPNNMQMPKYQFHINPTLRIEKGSFMSSNDLSAKVEAGEGEKGLWAFAKGKLSTNKGERSSNFEMKYTIGGDGFWIEAKSEDKEAALILPIVSASGETVMLTEKELLIKRRDCSLLVTVFGAGLLKIPKEYCDQDGSIRRLFSPVGGLEAIKLTVSTGEGVKLRIQIRKD